MANRRLGGWLPQDPKKLQRWVKKTVQHAQQQAKDNPIPVAPPVAELHNMVLDDPQLYMLFNEMLTEVPAKYDKDPANHNEIRDVETLMLTLNYILKLPPSWDSSAQVGTPINAILDWPMGTKAGFAVFLKDKVNKQFEKILKYWADFLVTPESISTLNDGKDGWFSQTALNSPHMKYFAEDFPMDPTKPGYGYRSWDRFFTRDFRPGRRPVASPDDDGVIVSATESTPFRVQPEVNFRDTFWMKGQKYSLTHMMDNDDRTNQFVGGTVYQAFLSADSYHRWHSPVSGKIVSFRKVAGTYYSEPLLTGFSPDKGDDLNPDPGADEASQGYISSVAARAIIFVQADNPDIGLMCMIMVGMAEVSSVELTMPIGQAFKKGDQLGMFHFGGSTHCLIFGPQVQLEFKFPENLPSADNNIQWPVNSALATVTKLPKVTGPN